MPCQEKLRSLYNILFICKFLLFQTRFKGLPENTNTNCTLFKHIVKMFGYFFFWSVPGLQYDCWYWTVALELSPMNTLHCSNLKASFFFLKDLANLGTRYKDTREKHTKSELGIHSLSCSICLELILHDLLRKKTVKNCNVWTCASLANYALLSR